MDRQLTTGSFTYCISDICLTIFFTFKNTRPDIVNKVFHARLQALLHNLRSGKYFDNGVPIYIMRVIEYQFRGLPHAHIVFRLANGPIHSDQANCIRWIEKHICSTMPIITTSSTEEDHMHFELATTAMYHTCFRGIKMKIELFGPNITVINIQKKRFQWLY